ncbi:hypothetical protein D9M68_915660 [compost metagenome]
MLVNQVTAKTSDSRTVGQNVAPGATAAADVAVGDAAADTGFTSGAATLRGKDALSGSPSSRCRPAQHRQAPRQPSSCSSHAVSGQPTVLAKPAIRVMPVMLLRASWP